MSGFAVPACGVQQGCSGTLTRGRLPPSTALPAWLPGAVRCSDDLCRDFLASGCSGGCGRTHWAESSCQLLLQLRGAGKLTHEVSIAIQRFGLEELGDLAYSFDSNTAADHGITDAWAYANTGASGEAASLAADSLQQASASAPSNVKATSQAVKPIWKKKNRHFMKRGTGAALTPIEDEDHRRAAAESIADEIMRWAPTAGVFCDHEQLKHQQTRTDFVNQIMIAEASTLKARWRTWRAWKRFCCHKKLSYISAGSAQQVTAFMNEARGQTGLRGRWNSLSWLAKVAKAPIFSTTDPSQESRQRNYHRASSSSRD